MEVTVSGRAREQELRRAASIAELPSFEFKQRAAVDWDATVLQVSRTGLCLKTPGREYHWHPGLLHTRVEAGWTHPLVRAMDLTQGDRVLDCTLGLGTDAHFASEYALRQQVDRLVDESMQIIVGKLDHTKSQYKEVAGTTLKLEEISNSDSIEMVSASNHNPRKIPIYRRNCVLRVQ